MSLPGRPGHVLHIGNILNNGYLHCKYLRKHGFAADCLDVDDRHCQSQPEWAEVPIHHPVDQWSPDWSKVDLRGFQRPDWFMGLTLAQLEGAADDRRTEPTASDASPEPVSGFRLARRKAAALAEHMGAKAFVDSLRFIRHLSEAVLKQGDLARYWRIKRRLGIDDADWLSPSNRFAYLNQYVTARAYRPMVARYQMVHAYSVDPINVMLADPAVPLVCYEHGTLREIPFEDTVRGKLYSKALKRADKVIITNADCIGAARRLGLHNTVFIPHIVDDDQFRPRETPLRQDLLQRLGCDVLLVAPARHHWKHAPAGLENSWFKRNDVLIRGLGSLFASKPKARIGVVFFDWGAEVELSKQLIAELGFADRVLWEPMRSKPVLCDYYNAADIVLDQFNKNIGTFGGIVPEAMACAKPVMLSFNLDAHRWCYPSLPPVIDASDPQSIAVQLARLVDHDDQRRNIGAAGRSWFEAHHSSSLVIGRLLSVYREVYQNRGLALPPALAS